MLLGQKAEVRCCVPEVWAVCVCVCLYVFACVSVSVQPMRVGMYFRHRVFALRGFPGMLRFLGTAGAVKPEFTQHCPKL
jgi:hypothetical protein